MEKWERRNQGLARLRGALKKNPTNLELANRYWCALAGDGAQGEADLRSGRELIEAYRELAVSSGKGIAQFVRAYRDLFESSGESPRPAYFDERLVMALRAELSELSGTQRSNVECALIVASCNCTIGLLIVRLPW